MTNLNYPNLAFFNRIVGRLYIEPETLDVELQADVPDEGTLRNLTREELNLVVFQKPYICLRGLSGDIVSHKALDGRSFTVSELLAAVERTEQRTRKNSEWLGGIDVHHIYFEGIHQTSDGPDDVWNTRWGS